MSADQSTTSIEYREIPESEGYLFGSDGSIWSLWGKGYRKPREGDYRKLSPTPAKSGHLNISVKIDGKMKSLGVHVLILWAFKGPCPPGMECRHLNGNPADNRPDNLEWGTRQENIDDQVAHGVFQRGERQGLAKLTEDQVREIRRLRKGGETLRALGAMFGVAHCTIKLVVRGDTWKHVG